MQGISELFLLTIAATLLATGYGLVVWAIVKTRQMPCLRGEAVILALGYLFMLTSCLLSLETASRPLRQAGGDWLASHLPVVDWELFISVPMIAVG